MGSLLNDLVDFNRTQLGLGMTVVPADIDLAGEFADELEQLRGAHSNRRIEYAVTGDTRGQWDGGRLKQVLRNLVSNAFEHASSGTPVRVMLAGEEGEVRFEVVNEGPSIEPSIRSELFEPLRRGDLSVASHNDGLGLGLFIVREITRAHCGRVEVRCDEQAGTTTFAVCLPRQSTGTVLTDIG